MLCRKEGPVFGVYCHNSGLIDVCQTTAPPGTCLTSEPTNVMEFPGVPAFRLDYALMNDAMVNGTSSLACDIRKDNKTAALSDHYPVVCEWQFLPQSDTTER